MMMFSMVLASIALLGRGPSTAPADRILYHVGEVCRAKTPRDMFRELSRYAAAFGPCREDVTQDDRVVVSCQGARTLMVCTDSLEKGQVLLDVMRDDRTR